MSVTNENVIANEIFERLDAVAGEVGRIVPVVWEKMVTLTYYESLAFLIIGGICLLASIIAWVTFFNTKNIPASQRHYTDPAWPVNKFIAGGAGILFMIPGLINVLYPMNWIGVFSPESRLIAKLIYMATVNT